MMVPRLANPMPETTHKLRPEAQSMVTDFPIVATSYPLPSGDFFHTRLARTVRAGNTTVTHVNPLSPVEMGWTLPPGGSDNCEDHDLTWRP